MAKKIITSSKTVSKSLRQVVADSYALLGQLHLCHWNVEGPSFFTLHQAFEEQYTELFTAIDEIAERIRALGDYAPGGLGNLAKMAGFKEIEETADAKTMVEGILKQQGMLIDHLGKARDVAAKVDDKETEDLMIARIQIHEKNSWMLRSFLKG